MRQKVYVVTAGHYSDYHILAVFASRSAAELFRSTYKGIKSIWNEEVNEIEEYDLYPSQPPSATEYQARWDTRDSEIYQHEEFRWGPDAEALTPAELTSDVYPSGIRWVRVKGTDKEKVLKVLSDKRAEILAEQAGLT